MRINNNISALNAYRNMVMTDNRLNKSLERLSSGLRINRAADDAAGLAISEKMRGQIRGLNQAMRNAQDGISLIQTAEGALNETHSILQRMRELSVQAANDTLTAGDRMEIQKEIDQLTQEIDRIANTTEFNTKKLLDGTTSALTSTDNLKTKVFMRDGLRVIDQFGQKAVEGGNFRLDIEATPGAGQVQKTDIMKIKHAGGTAEVETLNDGRADGNAFFEVNFLGTVSGGSYTLRMRVGEDGVFQTTDPIQFNATADDIHDAIAVALGASGSVSVTTAGINQGFTVEFNNDLANTPVELEVNSNTLTGTLDGVAQVNVTDNAAGKSDGSFTIAWNGNTGSFVFNLDLVTNASVTLNHNADAAAIKNAVSGANNGVSGSNINVIQTTVAGFDNAFIVEIAGLNEADTITVSNLNFSGLTSTGANIDPRVETLSEGGRATNEIQNVTIDNVKDGTFTLTYYTPEEQQVSIQNATSGTFTLSNGDQTSDAINWNNVSREEIIEALEGLYGEGSVQVTMAATGFTVTFFGQTEAANLQIGGDNLATGGSTLVVNVNEITAFAVSETTPLAYDASAEQVQSALRGVLGAGNVNVTGEAGNWEVTFTGDFAGRNVNELVINSENLVSIGDIGDIAVMDTQLRDIDRFWDASGNFLIDNPQTLTLVQGDGGKASITIFGTDTIRDVETKLNNAIGDSSRGLGQREFLPEGNFVSYVLDNEDRADSGHFSVAGTFVIQSAITGNDGEINFIGDEGFINALSLTTIQESSESLYSVTVTNAHNGEDVASDRISGNVLIGTVHQHVDVKFDPMANIALEVAEDGTFSWVQGEDFATYVHLADNSMVFHIGANPLQDVDAAIGDMRAEALGVDNILVTDRGSANKAIATLDRAIGQVSAERSKMGALQNRLEHTINNLGVSAENLTAAESRIRDLDFAMEMIEFTRNQIMMQAGTAMLAQANMKPQSVLMLLG